MYKQLLFIIFLIYTSNNLSAKTEAPFEINAVATKENSIHYKSVITIRNTSKSEVIFWIWSCDTSDSFKFNSDLLMFEKKGNCDKNCLIPYALKPNQKQSFVLYFKILDLLKVEKAKDIRIGFIYIKDRKRKENRTTIWTKKVLKL